MSEFRIPSSNQSVPPSPLPFWSTVSEEQNTTQTCLQDSPFIEEKDDSSSISEANSILPSNSPVDYSGDDLEKVGVQIKQSLASIFLNLFTSSSEDKEDPLVERLAARITQQLPNNPTLLESESIGLYKCMLREALKHFPPRNPEASEDEILMDMFNCFAKRGWRVMADNFQKCSPEGSQIAQLANIISKIDPHVTEHLENHGLEGLFTSGVPIDFSEDVLPFQEEQLKELNSKHGTEFKDIFEAYHFINKKELRASIEERLKSKAEENFIRLTFEAMARASKLKIFAECVCDDIQENLTPETSSVLKLLDLFIIDFIQKYHESIWFNDGKSNFGYHRAESDWETLLVSDAEKPSELKCPAFLNRVVTAYLDNFEELLDQFHAQAPLFKEHLNQFVKNLNWILTVPLDSCKQLTKEICQKRMSEEEASFSFFLRIFQRAFLNWAIEDVAFEDPELIPEWFTKEIKLRLMIASHLMKLSEDRRVEFISRFQCDEERVVLVEKVQQLMTRGIEAASFACANLVESRKPNHQKTDLTFGFGFKGWLFSSATGIRSSEQEMYLNLSESGRTLPNAKNLSRSLFSLPFLYATRYLMQEKHRESSISDSKDQPRSSNSQEQKHFKTKDLIPTKILTRPTEKDKKIHLYLFQRILYHYFVNDRIEVYHEFYSAIKDELMRCIEAKKTVQVNEQRKKIKDLQQRLNSRKATDEEKHNLRSKINEAEKKIKEIQGFCAHLSEKIRVNQERPLLSKEEFEFVLSALDNKSAICVEAVISKQSKNSLIVPLSFNQERSDIVKVKDRELRIGTYQRPVIPPCDKYCQLFGGSHILWAELTRIRTLDELDKMDKEKGGQGLQRLWGSSKDSLSQDPSFNIMNLFNRLEILESKQSVHLSEVQELAMILKKIWEESDPELDSIFLNLFTRVENILSRVNPEFTLPTSFDGKMLSGTFNQFSSIKRDGNPWPQNASRSSCTANALMFLSYLFGKNSVQAWEAETDTTETNIINKIIDEGRAQFEQIVRQRREGHISLVSTAIASGETSTARDLLFEHGGDALHVSEILNIEEMFFLTSEGGIDTLDLTRERSSNTTIEFFKSYLDKIKNSMQGLDKLGVIIQCNGFSYGLALMKQKDTIEYAIFDSHGCHRLNGHGNAFVYWSESLDEAAIFLGNLIRYQDLELKFLTGREKEVLMEDYQVDGLNQVATYLFKPRNFGAQ